MERLAPGNLLPYDGVVDYRGVIFSSEESQILHDELLSDIPWKSDEVVMFGKRIVTARKTAWYGDSDFSYTYSGGTKQARPWTTGLARLKSIVGKASNATYNSCLLNLYHDGGEGMGWHSDDEKSLAEDAPIASLSFGAEREFRFKHKRTDDKISILLENGSLIVMRGPTQRHWLHSVPKSRKITTPRINLTFRTMAAAKSG